MKTFWLIYGMAVFLLAYILLIRPDPGNINCVEAHGYDWDEIIDHRTSIISDRIGYKKYLQGKIDILRENQLQAQFDLPNNYYWRAEQHRKFLNGLRGRK